MNRRIVLLLMLLAICIFGSQANGRFLSPDPLGHASSMSLYDYANGDPVNGLDPDGRCSKAWSSDYSSSSSSYSYGSSSLAQVNASVYLAMNPLSAQQRELPTFSQIINSAISLVMKATVGLAMDTAASVATHFYNGMTGTDINTGQSISGWSRLGNAAMFVADIAPMVGSAKVGTGAMGGVASFDRTASTAMRSPARSVAAKTATQDVMVIGRQKDTADFVGKSGYQVLDIHPKLWDINVNDAWIQAGIDTRASFKLSTDINFKNLTRRVQQADGTFRHEPAVYLRELKQLRDAGYTSEGGMMIPPK